MNALTHHTQAQTTPQSIDLRTGPLIDIDFGREEEEEAGRK